MIARSVGRGRVPRFGKYRWFATGGRRSIPHHAIEGIVNDHLASGEENDSPDACDDAHE